MRHRKIRYIKSKQEDIFMFSNLNLPATSQRINNSNEKQKLSYVLLDLSEMDKQNKKKFITCWEPEITHRPK